MEGKRYTEDSFPVTSKATISTMWFDISRREYEAIDYLIEELKREDPVLYESALSFGQQRAQDTVADFRIRSRKKREAIAQAFVNFYLAGVAESRAVIKRQLASNRLENELKL